MHLAIPRRQLPAQSAARIPTSPGPWARWRVQRCALSSVRMFAETEEHVRFEWARLPPPSLSRRYRQVRVRSGVVAGGSHCSENHDTSSVELRPTGRVERWSDHDGAPGDHSWCGNMKPFCSRGLTISNGSRLEAVSPLATGWRCVVRLSEVRWVRQRHQRRAAAR
jgi:hypothetical protein